MPGSFVENVPAIVRAFMSIEPRPATVVDVGPGWGKYGLMVREYLGVRPDAIEVPQGRLATQDAIYGVVREVDVRDLDAEWWALAGYSLALLVDVIEHMEKTEGAELIGRILDAGTVAIVSTPKIFMESSSPTNPHESHVCLWAWDDFSPFRHDDLGDFSTESSTIYVLTPKEPDVSAPDPVEL